MEDQETDEEKVTSLIEAMLVADFKENIDYLKIYGNKRLRVNVLLNETHLNSDIAGLTYKVNYKELMWVF